MMEAGGSAQGEQELRLRAKELGREQRTEREETVVIAEFAVPLVGLIRLHAS